uniref:Uncharacterized protein n=1 Tax=Glossina palpalis gambiensis TaxID=67801 RepID=A0A1B0B0Y4_9MUSC
MTLSLASSAFEWDRRTKTQINTENSSINAKHIWFYKEEEFKIQQFTYAADITSEQEVLNGHIYSFSRAAFQLRVISIQKVKVVVIPNHEELMAWKMEPRGFINKSFR